MGDKFESVIEAFVRDIAAKAAGGLTLRELGESFVALIHLAVLEARSLALSGYSKKSAVLDAVAYQFDALAPAIPLPIWLAPFRKLLHPVLKRIVLALADGAIEAIYSRLPDPAPDPKPT